MKLSMYNIFETTVEIVSLGLTFWGAFKMNRKYFLTGICLFSILPIIGETSHFLVTHEALALLTISIFVAQFILSFPSNITYNSENTAATLLSVKISLVLLIINLVQGFIILNLITDVNAQHGYAHILIGIALLYMIIKRFLTKGVYWK
jgi:hypothetical protein